MLKKFSDFLILLYITIICVIPVYSNSINEVYSENDQQNHLKNNTEGIVNVGKVTVLPKEVFVGDIVEVRFSFETELKILEEDKSEVSISDFSMNPEENCFNIASTDDFTVKSASLYREKNTYTLSIIGTPWKSGDVVVSPILFKQENDKEITISIPSFKVYSILERTGKKEIQPVKPPLIIPGTTWVIYIIVIITIFFFILLLKFLLNTKKYFNNVNSFFSLLFMTKNYRHSLRKLKKILRKQNTYSSKQWASECSLIIREYFSKRFMVNFLSATTAEIFPLFTTILGDTQSKSAEQNMQAIMEYLYRFDIIRYSYIKDDASILKEGEIETVTSAIIQIFKFFERNDTNGI